MKVTFDVDERKQFTLDDVRPGEFFILKDEGCDDRPFMMLKAYCGGCGHPNAIDKAIERWREDCRFVYVGLKTGQVFSSEVNMNVTTYEGELTLRNPL